MKAFTSSLLSSSMRYKHLNFRARYFLILAGVVIAPHEALAQALNQQPCSGPWSIFNHVTSSTIESFCTLVNSGVCSTNPNDTLNTDPVSKAKVAQAYQAKYHKPLPPDASQICKGISEKNNPILCAPLSYDSVSNSENMYSVYNQATCQSIDIFTALTNAIGCSNLPISTILYDNPYCADALLSSQDICLNVLVKQCKGKLPVGFPGFPFPKQELDTNGVTFKPGDLQQMWGICVAKFKPAGQIGWTASDSSTWKPQPVVPNCSDPGA